MNYATQDGLIKRFGERLLIDLTDRADPPTGVVDAAIVTEALEGADAVINGYLAARYTLPLTKTQDLITRIAEVVAIWDLHTFEPNTKIERDYSDALKSLREISTGMIKLEATGVALEGKGGTGARVTDRERPMTAANLKGFI